MAQQKTADHYDALKVRQLTMKLFQMSGVPTADAAAVADRLIGADLAGKEVDGIARIPEHLEMLRAGRLDTHGPDASWHGIKSATLGKPVPIRLEREDVAAIQKELDRAGVRITLFNLRIREAA